MSQENLNTLIAALMPVVVTLIGLLTFTLRQQVEVKTAAIKHEELRKWVTTLVTSAEQQFADWGSDETKLSYATEQTLVFVQSLGLTLSREQVRALIESAVRAMTVQEKATVTLSAGTTAGGTTTSEASITTTPEDTAVTLSPYSVLRGVGGDGKP